MKYSFVLPAFKVSYLKEAIDSILSQTYKEFELIIVNDASPDDIDSIVESYSDSRIKYYKNVENIGGKNLIKQWNYCISLSKSDYIILASDDDIYDSEYLNKMDTLVDKYPEVNVFRPRIKYIDSDSQTSDLGGYLKEFSTYLEFLDAWIKGWIGSGIPYYIFNREALMSIGGFADYPLGWFSDDATILRLSTKGIVSTTDILFSFRVSDISISGRKNSYENLKDKVAATNQFYVEVQAFLRKVDYPNVYSVELRNSIQKWFPSFMQKNKLYTELFNTSLLNTTKLLFPVMKLSFISKKTLIHTYIQNIIR